MFFCRILFNKIMTSTNFCTSVWLTRTEDMHVLFHTRLQETICKTTAQQSPATAEESAEFNSSRTALPPGPKCSPRGAGLTAQQRAQHEALLVSAVCSMSQRIATLPSRRQFSSLGMLSSTSSSLRQPSLRNCCTCVCTRSVTAAYLLALKHTKLASIKSLPHMEFTMVPRAQGAHRSKSAIIIIVITSRQYYTMQTHEGCKIKPKRLHRKHDVSKMQTCSLTIYPLIYTLQELFLKNDCLMGKNNSKNLSQNGDTYYELSMNT